MIVYFNENCLANKNNELYKDYIIDGKAGDSNIVLRLKNSLNNYSPPIIFSRKLCSCCREPFYIKKGNGITVCSRCQSYRDNIFNDIEDSEDFGKYFSLFGKFKNNYLYYNLSKTTDKNSIITFVGHYSKFNLNNSFFIEPQNYEDFEENKEEYKKNSFYVYKKIDNVILFRPLNSFMFSLINNNIPTENWNEKYLENKKVIIKEIEKYLVKLLENDVKNDAEFKGYKLIKDFINPYYNKNDGKE